MSQPPQPEHRKSPRYSCIMEASWEGAEPIRFNPAWPIRVTNISAGGVALHVGEKFAVGTVLTLGLRSPSKKMMAPMQVRVVHVTDQANGTYVLGAAFLKALSESEVQELLS